MKNSAIIIIILFFVHLSLYAQNFNSLRVKDSIYLYFDENEKFDNLHLKKRTGPVEDHFIYVFPDGQSITLISYVNEKFKNDKFFKYIFCLQNINKIYTLNDIREIGYSTFVFEIVTKKIKIFIIDKKNLKKHKFKVRKMFMSNDIPSEM